MALVCEDLARYGVVLIPPSTEKYFDLLADIERRLQIRPKGSLPVENDTIKSLSSEAQSEPIGRHDYLTPPISGLAVPGTCHLRITFLVAKSMTDTLPSPRFET
jgi:hypothetical protein